MGAGQGTWQIDDSFLAIDHAFVLLFQSSYVCIRQGQSHGPCQRRRDSKFVARALGAVSLCFIVLSCDFENGYKSVIFLLSLSTIAPSDKSYSYMTFILHLCHITVT